MPWWWTTSLTAEICCAASLSGRVRRSPCCNGVEREEADASFRIWRRTWCSWTSTCPTLGLDLLESIPNRDFYLVFTTAFDRYAVDAVRKQAFDYLLKPINRDDLQACARRILMHFYHHRTPEKGASSARSGSKSSRPASGFVRHRDIVHIEAEGSYDASPCDGRRIP